MENIFERIERKRCPSCGRKTLMGWEDEYGLGAQCASMDCLETFEVSELFEDASDDVGQEASA